MTKTTKTTKTNALLTIIATTEIDGETLTAERALLATVTTEGVGGRPSFAFGTEMVSRPQQDEDGEWFDAMVELPKTRQEVAVGEWIGNHLPMVSPKIRNEDGTKTVLPGLHAKVGSTTHVLPFVAKTTTNAKTKKTRTTKTASIPFDVDGTNWLLSVTLSASKRDSDLMVQLSVAKDGERATKDGEVAVDAKTAALFAKG